jgi:hypothetical protein
MTGVIGGVGPRMQQMLDEAQNEAEKGLDQMRIRGGCIVHYKGRPVYLASEAFVLGSWENFEGDGNVVLDWVQQ